MGATAAAQPVENILLEGPEPLNARRRPDFKIFTRGVEVLKTNEEGDEDGVRRIRCIASSSVKDLHGDTMTAHCVRSMAKQAEGLTIFLNHSYRMPEDVFGTVEKARSKKISSADAKAKGWIDTWSPDEDVVILELDVALSAGQRIDDTFTHMEKGVRLGVSIGANITEWEEEPGHEDSWWPPLIINDVDLLEASIVGIPANPLSWVEGAAKGLIRRGLVKGADEETFQMARRAYRQAAEEGTSMTDAAKKKTADTAQADEPAAEADNESPESKGTILDGAEDPEEIVAHYQTEVEAGLRSKTDLDALEDDIQKSIDSAKTKDPFKDRTAADLAKEVLASIPADEAEEESTAKAADAPGEDEEAPESSPDSDDEGSNDEAEDDAEAEKAAATEMTALAEKGALKSATDMAEVIKDLLRKNAILSVHNGRLVSEKAALIAERDEAAFNADEAVKLIREIMELPLARKSAPIQRATASGAEKLKGKLSDELLSILYPPEE